MSKEAVRSESKADQQQVEILELSDISRLYPKAILTMDSAFYFYGLTDTIPDQYDLATGRNASKITNNRIHQYFIPEDFLETGLEYEEAGGVKFRIYSRERMLIELLRFKARIPYDYYKEIIHSYRRILPTLNIQKIQDYALTAPNSNVVCRRLFDEVL